MRTLPTLLQIYNSDVANLNAEFGVNISIVKKVALRVIAAVHSAKIWLLYKSIAFLQKNIWPDTADSEFLGGTLERFGRTRLGRNPTPARAGKYTVEITGSIGATIPAGQTYKSDDDSLNPGKQYILDSVFVLTSPTDTIILRALIAGTESKLNINDTLTPTSPIPLVNSSAKVTAETVQPLAAESLEDYRAAILISLRLEAQGGAATDYRIWAQDAQGVQQVYPYPKDGETNANIIFVEATIADSIDGKGTPSQAMLDDVYAVTNFNPDTSLPTNERGRRPNTVKNYPEPITPLSVDIEVQGFTGITASQQTLIIAALTASVNKIRPYIPACDIPENQNNIIDVNRINGIIYAQIPGANYSGVELKVNSIVLLSYTFMDGDIPYVNTITFT